MNHRAITRVGPRDLTRPRLHHLVPDSGRKDKMLYRKG
uniref:Uncharacterized protein n=1 Tax=Anguilla anguilla TaxID=7936 RepID=A0A0E9S004_ANGAN